MNMKIKECWHQLVEEFWAYPLNLILIIVAKFEFKSRKECDLCPVLEPEPAPVPSDPKQDLQQHRQLPIDMFLLHSMCAPFLVSSWSCQVAYKESRDNIVLSSWGGWTIQSRGSIPFRLQDANQWAVPFPFLGDQLNEMCPLDFADRISWMMAWQSRGGTNSDRLKSMTDLLSLSTWTCLRLRVWEKAHASWIARASPCRVDETWTVEVFPSTNFPSQFLSMIAKDSLDLSLEKLVSQLSLTGPELEDSICK